MDRVCISPLTDRTACIDLAQCHLDDNRDIDLHTASRLLSADEAARARRFHFDRDRDRYIRGRGFLRITVGLFCGADPAGLVFGLEGHGKPFLQGSSIAFNLSHSRDLAVLALSRAGPVGIDLEFIDREVDIPGLAETCLTAEEARVLNLLARADRQRRFFAFWTAKEARMKLTGEGLSLGPRQIALDLRNGIPVGYLRPDTLRAQAFFLDLGHPGAVCCLALGKGRAPVIGPGLTEVFSHVAH